MKTISCVWNIGYKIRWKAIGLWVKMMTVVSQRQLCVLCTTGHDFLMSIHCYCTNCTGSGSDFQEMKQIVLESYTQHRMAIQMPEHRFLTARLEDQLYWHNRQARHTLDNSSLPHSEGGSSKTYSHPGTLGRMPWLQKTAWDCWNSSAVKNACCTVTRSSDSNHHFKWLANAHDSSSKGPTHCSLPASAGMRTQKHIYTESKTQTHK